MKGALAWFAENHVAANLLMVFIILAGIYVGVTMKVEVFPESSLDLIVVNTSYPGASPAEVEEAIVRRIEERVAGLAGIKQIDSVSQEGFGTVTIEVMGDWDIKKLLDEVKSEVDRITTLPDEAEEPTVVEVTRRSQVINVAVFGDVPEMTLKDVAERIKDDLTDLPEITLADFFGVRPVEIHVEIPEETLERYGLTLGAVAQKIQSASLDLPAGSVKTAGGEILIRTKGRRYWADEYKDVAIITRPDGSQIALGQLADIKEGFQDVDLSLRFQGKPAMGIQIFRVADQNAITVANAVKKYLKEIEPTLPKGVGVDYYQDMSEILWSRINLLLKNMAYGLVLVSLLLGMFLSVRLAFWVTLGIPISFLFGMMFLPYFDVSINMVSLFAFIMVLGIVVDDAIIIGENIFQKREEGMPPLQAAVAGASEVGLPVVFSVLTTVAAFWPLLLAGGMMGKIMRNLPVVVILVLMGSLLESLLILPSHLAGSQNKALRRERLKPRREKRVSIWLKKFINGPYAGFVDFCIRWRYATIAFALMLLMLVAGAYGGGILKFTFFPKVESDVLQCAVTLPSGTPVERTTEVVTRIEQAAVDVLAEFDRRRPKGSTPLFEQSAALLGAQFGGRGDTTEVGGHLANIWIVILGGEKRDVGTADLIKAWREKVGHIPDAESITYQSELFRAGNPIEVHLSMDNDRELLYAADELKQELRSYPGVFDINDSDLPGKPEMQLKLKPAARTLGVTLSDLATQVRHAFYGAEALRLLRGKDEVKVMVRYPDSQRRSLGYVEDMRIRLADGSEVPFSQVAEVEMTAGYASIQRSQRRRVIKVLADVDERVTNANEVRQNLEKTYLAKLSQNHPGLKWSMEGEGKEQKESLQDVIKGFALALFIIYALLAIPFKSFTQPFIVMSAIPFGLAGAAAGHLIMGYNITLISVFGMVGLAGVVVNDSLVLIDAANRRRREGLSPHDAVTSAGKIRFRAIILTSLTTFAGLSPMLMEKSLQAQFLIPMAISLGFGVLFATGVTLILIPCGYMILDDFHTMIERIFRRDPSSDQAGETHSVG